MPDTPTPRAPQGDEALAKTVVEAVKAATAAGQGHVCFGTAVAAEIANELTAWRFGHDQQNETILGLAKRLDAALLRPAQDDALAVLREDAQKAERLAEQMLSGPRNRWAEQIEELHIVLLRLARALTESPACSCGPNDRVGSYANAVAVWPPPEFGFTRLPVTLDRCIALEVLDLWAKGIVTIASCCGHNGEAPPILTVRSESVSRMRELGYRDHPDQPDSFYPRSALRESPAPALQGAGGERDMGAVERVKYNDGEVDEVVGQGFFHMEMLDDDAVYLGLARAQLWICVVDGRIQINHEGLATPESPPSDAPAPITLDALVREFSADPAFREAWERETAARAAQPPQRTAEGTLERLTEWARFDLGDTIELIQRHGTVGLTRLSLPMLTAAREVLLAAAPEGTERERARQMYRIGYEDGRYRKPVEQGQAEALDFYDGVTPFPGGPATPPQEAQPAVDAREVEADARPHPAWRSSERFACDCGTAWPGNGGECPKCGNHCTEVVERPSPDAREVLREVVESHRAMVAADHAIAPGQCDYSDYDRAALRFRHAMDAAAAALNGGSPDAPCPNCETARKWARAWKYLAKAIPTLNRALRAWERDSVVAKEDRTTVARPEEAL
jgi:hypothetical protein